MFQGINDQKDEPEPDIREVRQWEIDHANNKQEAWEWYHHVNRIESAHVRRDPQYVPHRYNCPPGRCPKLRDPVLVAQEKPNESV